VNSESASAAEIFARVIQLEKRGTEIGDRFHHAAGSAGVDDCAHVTVANLIKTNGMSPRTPLGHPGRDSFPAAA
jgi:C-terminal processing protease CtpA/Prc